MPGPAGGEGAVARLHLVDGVALLRPEEQVFRAMLDGRRNQQSARNPAFPTIEQRQRKVLAFADFTDTYRGRGLRSRPTSGSAIFAASGGAPGPRCGPTGTRCGPSATT